MTLEGVLQVLQNQAIGLWNLVITYPLEVLIWGIGLVIGWKLAVSTFRYLYMVLVDSRQLVYMKITMPREESQKDKDKAEEKDFKEKISIMEQFFRNIHELGELSLQNIMRTWIFKSDIISFELVAQQKVVDFYVVVHKRYRDLIEKQITSYYPNADIAYEKPYDLQPKGNKLKCYFAYLKNPNFYPLKTFKTLENDPLNGLNDSGGLSDELGALHALDLLFFLVALNA